MADKQTSLSHLTKDPPKSKTAQTNVKGKKTLPPVSQKCTNATNAVRIHVNTHPLHPASQTHWSIRLLLSLLCTHRHTKAFPLLPPGLLLLQW